MQTGKILEILKQRKFFLLFLLLVTLVTYGYQVARMGFYWDDWQAIFVGRQGSPALFWQYFAYDRPISAWTYIVTYPLFGTNAALWQIFTILLRWLTSAGMWWALTELWPDHSQEVSWMALLLAVFPGFTQQSISVAYSQHFISYAFFTCSLAMMVISVRRPKRYWLWTAPAVLLSLTGMLSMEYFAGLELLRPLILWFMLRNEAGTRGKRLAGVMRLWMPYLLGFLLFVVYRFAIFPRLSPDPGANVPSVLLALKENPVRQIIHLAELVLQDFIHLNLFTWVDTIRPEVVDFNSTLTLATWVLGLVIAIAAGWYLLRFQRHPDGEGKVDRFVPQATVLGFAGIILGGAPVWSTDRQSIVGMWSDRFALGPMFGVVILLVAILTWLVASPRKRAVVLGFLALISIGAQMRTVNVYRKYVLTQQETLWQIAWRMPALKPGTALLATKQISASLPDYTTTFLANMMYDPDLKGINLPYLLVSAPRYLGGIIPSFDDGKKIVYTLRNIRFEGNTSQAVALAFKSSETSADACARVLTDVDRYTPHFVSVEKDLIAVSHPEQILPASSQEFRPPVDIFGPEPAHTWCYYFEKADLARQVGDWETVRKLDQQATAAGFKTIYAPEMIPFIEGYAHLGDWEKAKEYTDYAVGRTPSMEPMMCAVWDRIESNTQPSTERDSTISSIRRNLLCPKKPVQ